MQKITIKVDGIKKRDKIVAQQERGGDRTLPGILLSQPETSRSTILLYRILSARRRAGKGSLPFDDRGISKKTGGKRQIMEVKKWTKM